jgi:predicted phosphodiesterase
MNSYYNIFLKQYVAFSRAFIKKQKWRILKTSAVSRVLPFRSNGRYYFDNKGDTMSTFSRLTEVYEKAARITFDASAKIVLMSDCHRGDGSWVDNFLHNQHIYYTALKYYYDHGFSYIDLGDSEELWKFHNLEDISKIYIDIYRLLHHFYKEKRLYMIFGNHDIEKRDPAYAQRHMASFYDNHRDAYEPLFEGIKVHEGIILQSSETGREIFLVHGHQGDIKDDQLWKAGRFFVYHFWRRMEHIGFKDITSAAKNNIKKKKVEHELTEWAVHYNKIIIAGHTHRPTCPLDPKLPYFNVGSAVHPSCITSMELTNNELTLVKWNVRTKEEGVMFVKRQEIAVPRKI